MSEAARLPTHVEAAGLIRRVESEHGHAAVLRKGDPDRGSLILVIASRGQFHRCLERILRLDGHYSWQMTGPGEARDLPGFLAKRTRFDSDSWLIELDVADPERFIAELGTEG